MKLKIVYYYCWRSGGPLWSYCGSSRSPTVRPERYGAPRPEHSKVLTHFTSYPWWASLASSPVSLSVQNLYPRAKQHCRFFATISTGTLPPCRLRVGSSASSICWPKRPLSSAVRTVNYGLRGFSISGPRLWNTLPHDIRQSVGNLNLFKNKLKTYFFQLQQRH